MQASMVSNAQIEQFFNVQVLDSIYAVDEKGRRSFLTDLRQKFVKVAKKKTTAKKVKVDNSARKADNISDMFVSLERRFTESNVVMREVQCGIDGEEFKVYCIMGGTSVHCVNIESKMFNRAELEELFTGWSFHKKESKNGITINKLSFDDVLEVVGLAIEYHNV